MAKKIVPQAASPAPADAIPRGRTQADELNELQCRLQRAMALVDVLSEMSAPGGDMEAGAIALDQLKTGSLNTTLSVLNDLLIEAESFVQSAFDAVGRKEVAHG